MRIRILIITILSGLLPVQVPAQYANDIALHYSGYRFMEVYGQPGTFFNMAGIQYQRRVSTRWSAFISYSRLPLKGWLLVQERMGLDTNSIGKLVSRKKYQYADLGTQYALWQTKRHTLLATAGLSIAWGTDQYLSRVVWTDPEPGEPYGHPFEADFEDKKAQHAGLLLGLSYRYYFYKERLYMHLSGSGRIYHRFPVSVQYGIGLGLRF